jgi:hypothetical protein
MALNTTPIYSGVGDTQWAPIALAAANPAYDLSGSSATNTVTAFSASVSGGFVQRIRFKASGSTTNTTVARIFIGNALNPSTGSNVVLFDEITLAAVTATNTAATTVYEVPMNIALPAGYRILTALGTTVTGGWYVSAIGGSYLAP